MHYGVHHGYPLPGWAAVLIIIAMLARALWQVMKRIQGGKIRT